MTWLAIKAFATSPLGKGLLIGLFVLGLVAGIYFKGRGDQHRSDAVALAKLRDTDAAALATCQMNGSTLKAALDRQGAEVMAFKADSDARMATSQKQTQAARAVAESYRANAANILKAKPGKDACASAEALILESAR